MSGSMVCDGLQAQLMQKYTCTVAPVPKHYTMNLCKSLDLKIHAFVTSELDRAARSSRIIFWETATLTREIRDWMS
jgi:hypothetical protein